LSLVPSSQRNNAPRAAPSEIATIDFHMNLSLLLFARRQDHRLMPTPRPGERRHHQPNNGG
jgi:hypothetical protein